jgi:hypothetical protein
MLTPSNPARSRATRHTILVLGSLGMSSLALATLNWAAVADVIGACGPGVSIAVELPQTAKAGPPTERTEKAVTRTAARKAQVAVEYLPRPSQEEERIMEALATPVEVEFIDLPLEDCLTFISVYPQLPKFNLLIDRPTLTDEGVALDQPITLRLKGLRLEAVLNSAGFYEGTVAITIDAMALDDLGEARRQGDFLDLFPQTPGTRQSFWGRSQKVAWSVPERRREKKPDENGRW